MSVINDVQTNRVCALSISITSYFCLNTALYIVEYSDVNNNKTLILFIIIKLMQHKDTSQQAFLIIYLICILSFIYF